MTSECRKRLWGITTAPRTLTIIAAEPVGILGVIQLAAACGQSTLTSVSSDQKRESYHAHEGDDPAFGAFVGACHEHGNRCRRDDDAAAAYGQAKEHLKRDCTAQDFGHGGGDRG